MCSVVGCGSWRRGAQRFGLPEDPEKRLEWVEFLATINKQRFKESSWTDITICSEHFKDDCFEKLCRLGVTGKVQLTLKPSAVPSLCFQVVSHRPERSLESPQCVEPVENTDVAGQKDTLKTFDSPTSFSEGSRVTLLAASGGPAPRGSAETSDAFISGYGQMQPNTVNIDLIKEKAAFLKMKGKYVVNEKRLLQLFSCKCPSCGSKLKIEKITHGILIILNQQCLQCDYRNQWKSQAAPAGNTHSSTMGVSEIVIDEESASLGETEVSSDQGDMDSDEEWKPVKGVFPARVLQKEPDEETEDDDDDDDDEGEEEDDFLPHTPKNSQLCTECGMFYSRRWPHTCVHKIKPYSCNICGKRCVSEMALISHSRIHDENYEFRCKYCYVTFKTKVDKITHEQIHVTEGKPYKCPDCLETFATNKERKIHLEDHRGPKQLKCHICEMEFLWPLSLQRHLVVHTGVKPFKCSVCQRGFKQAGHLKSHMRLHTGERPYKCQHCDKCFNHNVSLKSHVQRYHTLSSAHELRKEKTNEGTSDTGESQNGNKRGADSGLDNVEEEQDTEEEVEKGGICRPKKKRRSTGRPIGRPKSFASNNLVLAIQMEGPGTDTTSEKFQVQTLKSDEGSVDEPTDSEFTLDSAEEEEEKSKESLKNIARSRERQKNSDSDSDFDPEDSKKNRSSGKSIGKRRGRPRKTAVV